MSKIYNKVNQITIVGAGSWGTAIAKVIAENSTGTIVKMWAYEKSTVNSINIKNINSEFLPGIKLPYNIKATNQLRDALINTNGIIIATPSKVTPDTVLRLSRLLNEDVPIAYLTKGFCRIDNEILTISQTISRIFPKYKNRIVGISGPSHAEEVSKHFHTTLSVAGGNEDDRKFFLNLLNCYYIQCRECEDIIGVDLGGTLKNPAAIAAGLISKIPGCGDNLEGALISESLKEMVRLGNFLGAKTETIIDISGTGDLVATALSDHSRNRRFGKDIAKQILEKGEILSWMDKLYLRFKPNYVLEKMTQKLHYLAEGAYAIEPLIELADKNGLSIPVYRSLYEVLLNKKEPSLLVETIKNPDKFEYLFNEAKLNVKGKKKGLEKLRGKAFEKLILNKLIANFNNGKTSSGELWENLIGEMKNKYRGNISEQIFFRQEDRLLSGFLDVSSEKNLKKISKLYLKEIIDHYNPFFYRLFLKFVFIIYYWNKFKGNRNKISVTGDFNNLHSLRNSVNTIYTAKFKNRYDYYYYSYGIDKYSLPVPRFLVVLDSPISKIKMFLLKKSGAFFVYRSKLSNPLYLECLMQYLAVLAAHGVPFLYFPEIHNDNSKIMKSDDRFFKMINNVMFNETVELVLIPAEIAYKYRMDETEIKLPLTEPVGINFSSPVFLSEFTKKSNVTISIPEMIQQIWTTDEIILPQYIVSGILAENNYIIKTSKLKKSVSKYISENSIIIDKSDRTIVNEGIKFLLNHSIISKKENYLAVLNRELLDKFAGIIKDEKNLKSKAVTDDL